MLWEAGIFPWFASKVRVSETSVVGDMEMLGLWGNHTGKIQNYDNKHQFDGSGAISHNGCSGSRYWVNATVPDVLRFGVVDQWRWLKPQGDNRDNSNQAEVGWWDTPPKEDRKYPESQHVLTKVRCKVSFLFWLVAWRLHSGHGPGSSAEADWGASWMLAFMGDKQIKRLHTVKVLRGGRLDNVRYRTLQHLWIGWTHVADYCRLSVASNQKRNPNS